MIGTGWASDPKTAPEVGSDPNYFTPPPSGRAQNYLYDLSNVDPNDINRLRDSVTDGEGSTFINRYSHLTTGLLGPGYLPMMSTEAVLPVLGISFPQLAVAA